MEPKERLKKLGKKPGFSSENEKKATHQAVSELGKLADSEMGSHLKKVTVAAKNPKDLAKGLDVAKEITQAVDQHEGEESAVEEAGESAEQEAQEHEEGTEMEHPFGHEVEASGDEEQLSEEELDAKLKKLMALKEKLSAKKV